MSSDSDLENKSFGESSISSESEESPKIIEDSLHIKKNKINLIHQKKEINPINQNDYYDDFNCYICLNPSINPVICRFCGNIACKKCFTKWVKEHFKCGCCRKNISTHDLISPPIINRINNYLKEIQNKKEIKCLTHNEKILFFCVNCIKKYCGKCLAFNSEESKNHIGHKILDYSEVQNSQYNELINKLESTQEVTNKIDINTKIYDRYKMENKIIFYNSISSLEIFKNMIFKKFEEKNKLISDKTDNLIKIKDNINGIYNSIKQNLQKLENVKKPIEDFNIEKNKLKLEKEIEKAKEIENQIESIQNKNNKMEFKTFHFSISKSKRELMKSEEDTITIKTPIYLEIQLEDESFLIITIPKAYEEKETKKITYFLPMVTFNNKLYEFKRNKLRDLNNSMDFENGEKDEKD